VLFHNRKFLSRGNPEKYDFANIYKSAPQGRTRTGTVLPPRDFKFFNINPILLFLKILKKHKKVFATPALNTALFNTGKTYNSSIKFQIIQLFHKIVYKCSNIVT